MVLHECETDGGIRRHVMRSLSHFLVTFLSPVTKSRNEIAIEMLIDVESIG